MSAPIELWKKYLRADPTRWLLETNDPSIVLWYQLDIAHRPEDAPGVVDARTRVLYSEPVQAIFATQNEAGYWGDPETLAQPYYNATLWNLALLAELGIPRDSRRARMACEFVLTNFVGNDGALTGLELHEMGYLVRALRYFLRDDPRAVRAAMQLQDQWRDIGSDLGTVTSLWAWTDFRDDRAFKQTIEEALAKLQNDLWMGEDWGLYGFPQFQPIDPLFVLRVLAEHDRVDDEASAALVQGLLDFQDDAGTFPLMESLNDSIVVPLEENQTSSRWITLNALRVITKLVLLEQNRLGSA